MKTLGRSVRECVPALADSVEQIVRSIMETGEPVIGIEVEGQRADQVGQRSWITYWHPLRAPGGEIVAVNVAAEEITERKRAEQTVRNARDAAETALQHLRETQQSLIEAEKLAALGRLVAGVAHEVNNPVGISLTVASTLERKADGFAAQVASGDLRRSSLNDFIEAIRDASSQLVSNLGRAAQLIQSFKQVAIDQSKYPRRNFDAGELAEQVLSQFAREVEKRGVLLRFHREPDLAMDGFPGPFGQVLSHLFLNSLTHAFPGASSGAIDVKVHAAGPDHVELLFADDGCGMVPEIRRQAFDPFFTTSRHRGATGLGLHIVYNIVAERLGGRINLESESGSGTKVQLVLPRRAPSPA